MLRASSSTWREVRIAGGRIGSAELYDASLNGVEFVGLKLGFVNLRGSTVTDVVFRDCVIDELDVADARLLRVSFEGTRIRSAEGTNSRIEHVDLRGADLDRVERLDGFRGATIGSEQLYVLAPMLAAQAGTAWPEPARREPARTGPATPRPQRHSRPRGPVKCR